VVLNLLEQKIIEKIVKDGPITFETFMEMALYEPSLGYYASDKTETGKAGDFYTSQHLHNVFGAMIGNQLDEMWETMGKPTDFCVMEFGAGEGYMCKDILDYLKNKEVFSSLTYLMVERNPFMQYKQKKLLEIFLDKVKWVSSLKGLSNIKGCILSNELLDALPVHLIEMDDELKEVYVTVNNKNNPPESPRTPLRKRGAEGDFKGEQGGFSGRNINEIKGNPSTDALADYIREFSIELPEGYRTEINLRIKDLLRSVNEVLSEGFILTIDYGYPAWDYYSEDRNRGTLLCYHRHQVNENPYANIGRQDITAHVNFSSVKKWGEELGLETLGFCQQGTFLVSLGIDEIIKELYENSSDYLFEVAKIKRLILPGTIGETHKVMIQYKGQRKPELRGFSIRNQKDKL
jgi:SAM-dependent MidA family methyltransferase